MDHLLAEQRVCREQRTHDPSAAGSSPALATTPIPTVVMSYGGAVTLDDLSAQVRRHREVRRALAVPYRHLAALATKEKNRDNREFIIVA